LAEAFTTIGPHWEKDPGDLKPDFDQAACEGLNLTMCHTFDCSPSSMGVPGQVYFAGTHINPQTTWWRDSDAFFAYLNRCHFMLQQGLPASDVLYFYGENIPNFVRLKADDPAGVQPDYDYDVISADALIDRVTVSNGRLLLPDGTRYEALALPPGDSYGLAALEQIARLVFRGARVVGTRPSAPIGHPLHWVRQRRFEELADSLWPQDVPTAGPPRPAVAERSVVDVLRAAGLEADFRTEGSGDGAIIDYIHRRTDDADIYFVANRRDRPEHFVASMRVRGERVELWDAVSGNIAQADRANGDGKRTNVELRLPPFGSVFVVVRADAASEPGDADATAQSKSPYQIEHQLQTLFTLDAPWKLELPLAEGEVHDVELPTLIDWTKSSDSNLRDYSGTAVYSTSFNIPNAERLSKSDAWIDLGELENVARVILNGKDLGVAWTRPYRVNVAPALRIGANDLTVEVTNLWPNRLSADGRLPADERSTRTNVNKFKERAVALPAGLFGPVRILTLPKSETDASIE
ncbi:MAG: hypothetical protein KDA61_00040, partial [Planctomycetales bacterium]|nr:hypothetical protein [Planctomycetales bacterium]